MESLGMVFSKFLTPERIAELADLVVAHRPDIVRSIAEKIRRARQDDTPESEDDSLLIPDLVAIQEYCKSADPTVQGYSLSEVFSAVCDRITAGD